MSGSRIANSSSTATVKSVADSKLLAAEPQLFVATQDALLGHGERLVKRLE